VVFLTYKIGNKEIMQIFGFLSAVFWILSYIIKKIIGGIIKRELRISLKQKLYYYTIPMTILFIITLVCIPFMRVSEGENRIIFIPIFFVFYIIMIISLIIHLTLNHFSQWLASKQVT